MAVAALMRSTDSIGCIDLSKNFLFGCQDNGCGETIHSPAESANTQGFAAICDALKACTALESLKMRDIGMGPEAAVMLSQELVLATALTHFDYSHNVGIVAKQAFSLHDVSNNIYYIKSCSKTAMNKY